MQSKSAPLTQNSVVAERAQLTQDRGGFYWKCREGDRASNSKEWLPMEMYNKSMYMQQTHTEVQTKKKIRNAHAHTCTHTFGSAVNTK